MFDDGWGWQLSSTLFAKENTSMQITEDISQDLIKGAEAGALTMVRLLLDKGAQVHAEDRYGRTALITSFGLEQGGGHLNVLFSHLDKELNQFMAEFDTIPGQIGALIIFQQEASGREDCPITGVLGLSLGAAHPVQLRTRGFNFTRMVIQNRFGSKSDRAGFLK